jgi:hypothetical protein
MSEPKYRVVWPLGKSTAQAVEMRPRIGDLAGKTIGHLSHGGFRDQEIRPIVEETLTRLYPGIKFVPHTVFGDIHGPRHGADALPFLAANLKAHAVDAVITGIGS